MDIILVPGLWLDASSWDGVVPALEAAGHRVRALTMPGVGAAASESAEIGISDWVGAVVAELDSHDVPAVLVGHSGGGNVVWGAADARPEKVSHVVFLDTFPPGDGGSISEFPAVDGVIPFPGWDFFDDADVADIDATTRADAASRTASVPARVPADALRLGDDRRRSIPATMITNTVREAEIRDIIEVAPPWASELGAVHDLRIIDVRDGDEAPGHWPQFTKPQRVADAILRAIGS